MKISKQYSSQNHFRDRIRLMIQESIDKLIKFCLSARTNELHVAFMPLLENLYSVIYLDASFLSYNVKSYTWRVKLIQDIMEKFRKRKLYF